MNCSLVAHINIPLAAPSSIISYQTLANFVTTRNVMAGVGYHYSYGNHAFLRQSHTHAWVGFTIEEWTLD
jgi:hypothetical protein